MPIQSCWVLSTQIVSHYQYLYKTSTRDFDNRNIITLTKNIDHAKRFATKKEALDFLSICITNDKKYTAEAYQFND